MFIFFGNLAVLYSGFSHFMWAATKQLPYRFKTWPWRWWISYAFYKGDKAFPHVRHIPLSYVDKSSIFLSGIWWKYLKCQCKHSSKRNRQDDCQYVHDDVLYISSRLHWLSRAVMNGWTDRSYLGWHCVMLITYVNIAFIGPGRYTEITTIHSQHTPLLWRLMGFEYHYHALVFASI